MAEGDADERFSPSGVPVAPVYRAGDVGAGLPDRLGEPGSFPFTRGARLIVGKQWRSYGAGDREDVSP